MLCSLLAGLLFIPHPTQANNLRFGTIKCDASGLHTTVAWDHSWNLTTGPANHDAVWVFAKIRSSGEWQHVRFSPNPDAHHCSNPGLTLEPGTFSEGILIKNTGNGAGHIATASLDLAWEQPLGSGMYEVQLFGIEMAYIPEGPFWLGDGVSNFTLYDSATHQPYFVISEDAIPEGILASGGGKGPTGELPAAYPKGYGGFYLMKYEISQSQYVDFLNTLTYSQQAARTESSPASAVGTLVMIGNTPNRNAIVIDWAGTASHVPAHYACDLDGGSMNGDQDGTHRACNWLDWEDVAAYLDWAALRPITELEYEKASRGPSAPTPHEFAWGTDSAVDANTPQYDGTANETVTETATATAGLGSHGYAGVHGPLRGGFGASATSDRLQAGAGYYGHMELSGNLWELCVSTRLDGLNFLRTYGDGTLSDSGDANVATWPSPTGVGYRGGAWNSGVIPGFRDLAVSDRFYIDWTADFRRNTTGGRGAR
jgi:formylglycine-generating enzyme required for sulfatase activity